MIIPTSAYRLFVVFFLIWYFFLYLNAIYDNNDNTYLGGCLAPCESSRNVKMNVVYEEHGEANLYNPANLLYDLFYQYTTAKKFISLLFWEYRHICVTRTKNTIKRCVFWMHSKELYQKTPN